MVKLISWNVNGIRSVREKGLFDWMLASGADVICLQETKAQPEQLTKEFHQVGPYVPYWSSALKKGYSGTVTYVKTPPKAWGVLGVPEFDGEGRVVMTDHGDFVLFNCYFPNSQDAGARLDYKLRFNQALHARASEYATQGRTVLICGDYNVAHRPIDLEYPAANVGNPGYLPEEREWMDGFLGSGWVDTFRIFHPDPKRYSWWSYRTRARDRNIGWRIDYFCVNATSQKLVMEADILDQVFGSDHCPVTCTLDLPGGDVR